MTPPGDHATAGSDPVPWHPAATESGTAAGFPAGVRTVREARPDPSPEGGGSGDVGDIGDGGDIEHLGHLGDVADGAGAGSERRPVPVVRHPEWTRRFPWLVQGVTTRGTAADPFDLALFGRTPAAVVMDRWAALAAAEDAERVVHGRQVHGAAVRLHREGPPGMLVAPATDGHVTRAPGTLLAVTVADCVPVLMVAKGEPAGSFPGEDAAIGPGRPRAPEARTPRGAAVAALHAGWRGVAAGVLEAGLAVLRDRLDVGSGDVHVHLGPAICGACYEVGAEVHEALGLSVPGGPVPVDLRAVLARRAVAAGVPAGRITVSAWCTRCGDSPFFSHRAGDPERQVAFVGLRG